MSVSLFVTPPHSGWMFYELADGENRLAWRASYLSDSFADLLEAMATVLSGEAAEVVFVVEPGCVVLDLRPMSERLSLVVVEHPDWPLRGARRGVELGRFDARLRTLAGAVLDAAMRLSAETLSYEAAFETKFPERSIAALAAALKKTSSKAQQKSHPG